MKRSLSLSARKGTSSYDGRCLVPNVGHAASGLTPPHGQRIGQGHHPLAHRSADPQPQSVVPEDDLLSNSRPDGNAIGAWHSRKQPSGSAFQSINSSGNGDTPEDLFAGKASLGRGIFEHAAIAVEPASSSKQAPGHTPNGGFKTCPAVSTALFATPKTCSTRSGALVAGASFTPYSSGLQQKEQQQEEQQQQYHRQEKQQDQHQQHHHQQKQQQEQQRQALKAASPPVWMHQGWGSSAVPQKQPGQQPQPVEAQVKMQQANSCGMPLQEQPRQQGQSAEQDQQQQHNQQQVEQLFDAGQQQQQQNELQRGRQQQQQWVQWQQKPEVQQPRMTTATFAPTPTSCPKEHGALTGGRPPSAQAPDPKSTCSTADEDADPPPDTTPPRHSNDAGLSLVSHMGAEIAAAAAGGGVDDTLLDGDTEDASFWEIAGVAPPQPTAAAATGGSAGPTWAERLAAKRAARGSMGSKGQRKRPRLEAVFAEDPETALITSSQQEMRELEVRRAGVWVDLVVFVAMSACKNAGQAMGRVLRGLRVTIQQFLW